MACFVPTRSNPIWCSARVRFGPPLFSLYVAPLKDIFKAHGINFKVYADDTQLYLVVKPDDRTLFIHKLEKCVKDIRTWTIKNKLVLSDGKT